MGDWLSTKKNYLIFLGCLYKGKEYTEGDMLYTDNTYPLPCYKMVCQNGEVVSVPDDCLPCEDMDDKMKVCPYLAKQGLCDCPCASKLMDKCRRSCRRCPAGKHQIGHVGYQNPTVSLITFVSEPCKIFQTLQNLHCWLWVLLAESL